MYFIINYLNSNSILFNNQYSFQYARNYDLALLNKEENFFILDQIIPYAKKSELFNFEKLIIYLKKIIEYLEPNNYKIQASFDKKLNKIKNYNYNNLIDKNDIIQDIKKYGSAKILGSGVNYNAAKLISLIINKKIELPISYDVLENHKHIDISSEPFLIILLGNIENNSYQYDAFSEIQKFLAHKNKCLVFSDENNTLLSNFNHPLLTVVNHTSFSESLSFLFYSLLFNQCFK